MSNKALIAVIIILVIAIVSILVYFLYLQEKPSAIDMAKQQVTSSETAGKASSDIKNVAGDIQTELADLQSVLP